MAKSLNQILSENEHLGILSVTTGQLEIAKIPVQGAPDWIIPQSLIISIDPYREQIWNYLWRGQDVSVFHLLPKTMTPDSLVVVESATDVHRIALQIQGEVSYHSVRIADLKDADTATYEHILSIQYPEVLAQREALAEASAGSRYLSPVMQQDYVFQPVTFEGELCVVPDLDKLSHFLVDLDS